MNMNDRYPFEEEARALQHAVLQLIVEFLATLAVALLTLAVLSWFIRAEAAAFPPENARLYSRLVYASSYAYFGSAEPVSFIASVAQTESRWRPEASAPDGGMGGFQFMPRTAEAVAAKNPNLGTADPYDLAWAIPAATSYLAELARGSRYAASECDRLAMAAAKYNGGGIELDRERARARGDDAGVWFLNVEKHNGRNRRADLFHVNRLYPVHTLLTWTPRFVAAGYGGADVCKGRRSAFGARGS